MKQTANQTTGLFEAADLFSHHLQENIKNLVANTNNTLHHACGEDRKGI